jgi:DNA-binding winged helix-turn-helix (wHTH) protein
MAMRIGREYSSDKVTPKDFAQLAGEAGLAKPLVRRRVAELATAAIEALGKIRITDKVSEEIAGLIRKRCARAGTIAHLIRASSTPTPTHTMCRQSSRIVQQCVTNNLESERFRFGLFEFSTATRELRREGVLIRLQSQPAQVLACLIERACQVVSREELRKILCGGETFVDFDGGLNFCISQIRSALRDESMQPTYIRTIPKHGYQFIAPVERVSERAPGGRKTVPARSGVNVRAVVLACAAGIFTFEPSHSTTRLIP